MVVFIKGQELMIWVNKKISSDSISTRAEEQLHPLIFPQEAVISLWCWSLGSETNWACAFTAKPISPPSTLRLPPARAPSLWLRPHPAPPVSVLRHGAPDPWRPRKWVGGLASARPRSRSRRWWPLGSPARRACLVAEPVRGPGSGPRMLNVPSQAFPAPGSQQRVASQGRSKVSGDAVVYWLKCPVCWCCWSWPVGQPGTLLPA